MGDELTIEQLKEAKEALARPRPLTPSTIDNPDIVCARCGGWPVVTRCYLLGTHICEPCFRELLVRAWREVSNG